ncbi:MCE family protein [Nocardioides sp. R-C-SC26]|uniref:MCE family protein n=1 Tax=Nocardioides sp. R-C-SC26 TaxID=2870414 RepID=UPI001E3A7120|nr:MlaD family protein [Nocardioides sp. R-C-SC26]
MANRRRSAPRKELRRIDLARRGLAGIVVIAVLLTLVFLRSGGAFGGDPEVTADVRNAGGALRVGSDVKVAGVIVGRVGGIQRGGDNGVRLDLRIAPEDLESIPGNVEARILPATVFGTTFVDLVVNGTASTTSLKDGAQIPADQSQGTLELQQALDDLDRLVTALGPAELNRAVSALATAVEGRGRALGEMLETADTYLGRLEPELPLVRSDLRALADNLEVVDEIAPDLLTATDDVLVTMQTIVAQRASITALITGSTTLLRDTDDLLSANEQKVVRFLRNGAILLDILYDNRDRLASGIRTNIAVGTKLPTAIRGFLRSDSNFMGNVPPFYTEAERPDYGPPSPLVQATLRGYARQESRR